MAQLIIHPSIVLIIGRRRYGKSALGYYILEKIHGENPALQIFVVSLPQSKHHLLPTWIHPVDNVEELPDDSVALIDEGSLKYHSHMWNKKETEVMDRLISISGQRRQTLIFITHTMRKFAVTLLLDINVLLCKKPSLLHSKLERSEFRNLMEEIDREFNKLPKDEVKENVYVISDDYKGWIKNPLPSFWSEDLSEAYAGITAREEEKKSETKEVKPYRIESGLKLWFKEVDTQRVLEILARNSTIDGVLSELGVQCAGGNCFYSWDLRKGRDNKYYLINDRFNIEKSMKELADEKISFVVDVESAYPLTKEDVVFKIEEKKALEIKDNLEEYGKKVKL